jgi:hypothetical protein
MNTRKQETPLADKFGRKFEKWSVDELRKCIINYRTSLGVSLRWIDIAMMIEEILVIRQVIDPLLSRAIKSFSGQIGRK